MKTLKMIDQVLTVSEFNDYVNQTLEYAYPEVIIEGEVSSFKVNQNKWVFFDLKDDSSTISCFMSIYQLKLPIQDGMLVKVHARPKLTQWGKFSITIMSIELSGEGSVKKAYEILKAKLDKEGIFSPDRKRLLPQFPKNIALITSRQAAAFNDFTTVLSDRWSGLNISHYQVQVQGEAAIDQIVEAVEYFNKQPDDYDALVIIRGGGSLEDLQVFQAEPIVRSIFASTIPTMVAIGHEDDVSLAELAADIRAATPTDAARRLVPDKKEFLDDITSSTLMQTELLRKTIVKSRIVLDSFNHSILILFKSLQSTIANYQVGMTAAMDRLIAAHWSSLDAVNAKLVSLNPEAVLQRGYAVVRGDGDSVVRNYQDISIGEQLNIKLSKGQLDVKVIDKYK
ncbi:MAG: exodeoxyribonuclease VII large subunit [Candidatus Saccharibacteria bacterium]